MSSGLNISGGNDAGNEAAGIGSSSRLPIGGKQDSPNIRDNNFMNYMRSQGNDETGNRRVVDGGIDNDDSGEHQVENINIGGGKKRYHRHTQDQIQKLEDFFKDCPHPDDNQKKVLSRDLGLEPSQIKFWFQNKRTQMKMHRERQEHTKLKTDNVMIRAENLRLRNLLSNTRCLTCDGPAAARDFSFNVHHLHTENAHLKIEIDRMKVIAEENVCKARSWCLPSGMGENGSSSSNRELFTQVGEGVEKKIIVQLAISAMEEFLPMAQVIEPLWLPDAIDGNTNYILNEDEYFGSFLKAARRRPGFRWEATRDSAIVKMDHTSVVKVLMDAKRWSSVFCGIVARAITIEKISTGATGTYDGTLQLMHVELQMITPLVPTRETCMARLCRKQREDTWVVVDVSLDIIPVKASVYFRKRPSGCLIQQLPNGCSKITWIEHVEVEDKEVNSIYRQVISSGAAFGAKYWISILQMQCERYVCSIAPEFPRNDIQNKEVRRSMLDLADRMVISFCSMAGQSYSNSWKTLSWHGNDEVKVMSHKNINNPGRPLGVVINVATSIWLAASPKRVFEFLRDENSRDKWDIYTKGAEILQMANITTRMEVGNNVQLLRVNDTTGNQNNMFLLQESFTYPTGSFIVYSSIDAEAMTKVLDGGDTIGVPLLPSGFAILPDGSTTHANGLSVAGSGGTLLTMVFQVLSSSLESKISHSEIVTIKNLMCGSIDRVRCVFEGTTS